jgi:hypothetical protein
MDMESITRWEDYSRAKDEMFGTPISPRRRGMSWKVRTSDGRINMIAHLLSTVSYYDLQRPPLQLPHDRHRMATNGRRGRHRPMFLTTPSRWRELAWPGTVR